MLCGLTMETDVILHPVRNSKASKIVLKCKTTNFLRMALLQQSSIFDNKKSLTYLVVRIFFNLLLQGYFHIRKSIDNKIIGSEKKIITLDNLFPAYW